MKQIAIYCLVFIVAVAVGVGLQGARLGKARQEAQRYKADVEALQQGIREYRTKDSLNVAQVQQLQLTLKEYERYREDDARLISQLRTKGRRLEHVITAQSSMIGKLQGAVRDTLIYLSDTVQVIARCVDIEQPYISLHGCVEGSQFAGSIEVRDSLTIVESVRYKRFLGFLWRTKKVRDRRWEIVSRNPDVRITGFEVVSITR